MQDCKCPGSHLTAHYLTRAWAHDRKPLCVSMYGTTKQIEAIDDSRQCSTAKRTEQKTTWWDHLESKYGLRRFSSIRQLHKMRDQLIDHHYYLPCLTSDWFHSQLRNMLGSKHMHKEDGEGEGSIATKPRGSLDRYGVRNGVGTINKSG
jgi:hypothetical protein